MPSYYTIVQYLPDPIAGERINVGALTFGEGRVRCRFLHKWARVQAFAEADIGFLQAFAEHVQITVGTTSPPAAPEDAPSLTEETIRRWINQWSNTIQFTPACASLSTPDELIDEVGERFLRARERYASPNRDRGVAARIAVARVKAALQQRRPELVRDYLKKDYVVDGRRVAHRFDVALANGRPYSLVHALSFEIRDRKNLTNEVDATVYAVEETRELNADVDIAILALPPKNRATDSYERAERAFHGLANFIPESQFAAWASAEAARLPEPETLHAH